MAAVLGIAFALPHGLFQASPLSSYITPLPGVEVTDYQGKDLSSINDFHENSILGSLYVNESDYKLTVTGLTNKTDVYTYSQVLAQYYLRHSKVVILHCVEGWDVTILLVGIQVRDLIKNDGIDSRASTVIFSAHGGYTTSFPLD